MSNHHHGIRLRHGDLPEGPAVSCREYRRSANIDAFPRLRRPHDFARQTLGQQVNIWLRLASDKIAKLFQNWWLDWFAGNFDVIQPLGSPMATLNVHVDDKNHIVHIPKYVADRLEAGTIQPTKLEWMSILVTTVYLGLAIAQLVLFILYRMSVISASVWGGASLAGIMVAAWFGGFPLVCSGIADKIKGIFILISTLTRFSMECAGRPCRNRAT